MFISSTIIIVAVLVFLV